MVSNVGRAIVKKLAVKFKGDEILGVDNFNVFACYRDLWKIHSDRCTENYMKLQINSLDNNTSNKRDVAIANTYGNKFIISLNFEMLESTIPYYQLGLGNRLCYKIMFNDYDRVIISPRSPAKPDAKYKIMDVSLEYEIITQPDPARHIVMEYQAWLCI